MIVLLIIFLVVCVLSVALLPLVDKDSDYCPICETYPCTYADEFLPDMRR